MEMPKPTEEHTWLQRLVGEWTFAGEMQMSEEGQSSTGTQSVRAFGGFWTVGEMTGTMPGSEFESRSMISLSYEASRGKYVGTFVSDMMSFLWIYEGSRTGDVLTLDCRGPSFKGDGSLVDYQDIIEIKSDDEYTLSSQTKSEDGTWTKFMSMTFTRAG